MLFRRAPFKEWITVYYDPEKISEQKILKLLHQRRCKSSKLDRLENDKLTAMNPFASSGEIIQLRITGIPKNDGYKIKLPDGWKITGDANGVKHEDGKTYLSIKVPEKTPQKKYNIGLTLAEGGTLEIQVEIVRGIGR